MNFPISGWRPLEVDPTSVRASIVLRDAQQGEDGRGCRPVVKDKYILKSLISNSM